MKECFRIDNIRNHFSSKILLTELVFASIEADTEINPQRGNLCTITDIVSFLGELSST